MKGLALSNSHAIRSVHNSFAKYVPELFAALLDLWDENLKHIFLRFQAYIIRIRL